MEVCLMKKLFIFGLILLLTLSIAACGGKSDTPASSPQNGETAGQEEITQSEQPSQQEQTEQPKAPVENDGDKTTVNQSFGAFSDARTRFDDYVIESGPCI